MPLRVTPVDHWSKTDSWLESSPGVPMDARPTQQSDPQSMPIRLTVQATNGSEQTLNFRGNSYLK